MVKNRLHSDPLQQGEGDVSVELGCILNTARKSGDLEPKSVVVISGEKIAKRKHEGLGSVTCSYLTLCSPIDYSKPGFPALLHLPEFAPTHDDAIQHLILCRPLLLLPSVFPSICVFANESRAWGSC